MTSLSYDIARCLKTDDNWDCPVALAAYRAAVSERDT